MNNSYECEVHDMTNGETAALVEMIKQYVKEVKDPEKIENALDKVQGVLKTPK